jgi:hypothetical protein
MEAIMSSQTNPNPSAAETVAHSCLCEVAQIARVPDPNQPSFIRLLDFAIKRAFKQSSRRAGKNISAGALTRDFFHPVVRAAQMLRISLERLQGEHVAAEEAAQSMAASHFFSEALLLRTKLDVVEPIGPFTESLNLGLVIEATEEADRRAKSWLSKSGRKMGTGFPAFDMFVMAMLVASERAAGRLTIYKTSYDDERRAGSLLKAVQQLRPLLPESNFFPAGDLGCSLHNVYQRWRLETEKSPRKKE